MDSNEYVISNIANIFVCCNRFWQVWPVPKSAKHTDILLHIVIPSVSSGGVLVEYRYVVSIRDYSLRDVACLST